MKNSAYLYKELKKREVYFKIATFTAFLASSLFIVGFFAGNIKFWTWNSDQAPYGVLGILITLAVTGFQRTLYSQGDIEAGKKVTWFAFFLSFAFGMMTEVGGGMEREEARMLDKSVSSPVFQSLMSNIGNITGSIGSNPYAQNIADAEAKKAAHVLELGRCDRHAPVGAKRVERCRVYEQTKIDELQSKISAYQQMAKGTDDQRSNALTASLAQAKNFERDEQNHHPLIKLIKEWFSVSPIFASFILSALIIGVFEYAFHYQGKSLAEIRNQFLAAGYDLTNGQGIAPTKYTEPVTRRYEQPESDKPLSSPPQTSAVASSQPAGPVSPLFSGAQQVMASSNRFSSVSTAENNPKVGKTELISSDVETNFPLKKNSIGFTAELDKSEKKPMTPSVEVGVADTPENPKADPAQISTPEARALLNTINNPKFDEVFIGVATGDTPTAIGKARKQHGTGAELVQSTLVCLEYCGIVSAKDANGKREVIETIGDNDAQAVMDEIKAIIRGAAK